MDRESVYQSDLYTQFTAYCEGIQSNLRDFGIILIQLINRRILTSDEYNYWKRWKVIVEASSAEIKSSHSHSEEDIVAPSKKDAENALSKQQINETKQQLIIDLPILKTLHPLITDLLALCFSSLSTPAIQRQESRKGLATVSMRFPAWKGYKALVSSLEDLVADLVDSGKFVKEEGW